MIKKQGLVAIAKNLKKKNGYVARMATLVRVCESSNTDITLCQILEHCLLFILNVQNYNFLPFIACLINLY